LNSSGKYLITLERIWSRPAEAADQASRTPGSIVEQSRFHTGFCINSAAQVPTRHGVHWPQLSSSKKRIRFSAPSRAVLMDRMITAAEPMKQPYFSAR
jgi:hypothetical protein